MEMGTRPGGIMAYPVSSNSWYPWFMDNRRLIVPCDHAELRRKLLLFSVSSRLFILLVSSLSNLLLTDHDAGVFKFPSFLAKKSSFDRIIQTLLGGLSCWDGQYFVHISLYGYTYENTLAFFPFFPIFTRYLAKTLEFSFGSALNTLSAVFISAYLINFTLFVSATITLFELSCKVLNDDKLGYISALFFCINPASIFFTAFYSESCFAFFTFSGMLLCLSEKEFLTSFAAGLSGCVRSNGCLNYGFIAHKAIKGIIQAKEKSMLVALKSSCAKLSGLIIESVIFFIPFTMFQCYTYVMFCLANIEVDNFLKEYGEEKGFITPGSSKSLWCNNTIPFSYSYVQNHHWNVGFLKYYEIKQIPNFVLAFPAIYLVLSNSTRFMMENNESLTHLGLNKVSAASFQGRILRVEFVVFTVHAVVLTVFCTLFVHIQVTTRMLASSCPVFYWFVALGYKTESTKLVLERQKNKTKCNYSFVETKSNLASVWKTNILTERPSDMWSSCVRLYFCSYFIIGAILFSNFYPWT